MHYDVTIITVRPGTEHKALARLAETLPALLGGDLLACWRSDIGALNRILLIRAAPDAARILRRSGKAAADRQSAGDR